MSYMNRIPNRSGSKTLLDRVIDFVKAKGTVTRSDLREKFGGRSGTAITYVTDACYGYRWDADCIRRVHGWNKRPIIFERVGRNSYKAVSK